jgi:hypothetical protein
VYRAEHEIIGEATTLAALGEVEERLGNKENAGKYYHLAQPLLSRIVESTASSALLNPEEVTQKIARIEKIIEISQKFLEAEEEFLNNHKEQLDDSTRQFHLRTIEMLKSSLEEHKVYIAQNKSA